MSSMRRRDERSRRHYLSFDIAAAIFLRTMRNQNDIMCKRKEAQAAQEVNHGKMRSSKDAQREARQ